MKAVQNILQDDDEYARNNQSSRAAILHAIEVNQPPFAAAPEIPTFEPAFDDVVSKFTEVLQGIGVRVHLVLSLDEAIALLQNERIPHHRIVSFDPIFNSVAEIEVGNNSLHQFHNVDFYLFTARLAVAESGAIWVTDHEMPERVLPFISQSITAVVYEKDIVPTLHGAYDKISDAEYGFATFISGPSKTADIEQSLVLGAHGPKTMTVFIVAK